MMKSTPLHRYESLLSQEQTTSKEDYRFGEIKSYPPTLYKPKEKCLRIRPPPLRNLHTLTDWTPAPVPFHLYHKNKDIVQTHPKNVQKVFITPPDAGKDEAIKTRPRLVMTPAVSMDDIEDPKERNILIKDMYVSAMTRRMKEAVRPYIKVQAPMSSFPAPAFAVTMLNIFNDVPFGTFRVEGHTNLKLFVDTRPPKLAPPYVSPEWRMESVSWDQKQVRSYYDSTKEFWLLSARPLFPSANTFMFMVTQQGVNRCRFSDESKQVAEHNKKMCELKPERRLQRR